jgi:chorismate dehydratase
VTGEERKRSPLRIGKINYANLFPIFYMLERECDCSHYEFIEGVPSTLNRTLRNGEIDISPSSSIEYLRHQDKYTIIDGHSISSEGPVGSIFLLSRNPIERLKGATILTTSQSETSVTLLHIILKKFYEIECFLRPTDDPLDVIVKEAEAYLSIGDEAMKAKKTIEGMYIYDLGELWYRHTGLPFVFALWIVRKNCHTEKPELFERFLQDLSRAKVRALENLDKIAKEFKPLLLKNHSILVTEDELISYWRGISYDLGEKQRKGLELFGKYSGELGLL